MHICSNCGHHEPIFGTGGAQKLAEQYHTQLLGQMPLHISLREDLDRGTPTVVSRPDSDFTVMYRELAGRVAAQLYWQGEVIPGEIAFRAVWFRLNGFIISIHRIDFILMWWIFNLNNATWAM